MRYIVIELSTGAHYGLPLEKIAANRAAYYAKKEGGTDEAEKARIYQEEFEYTMQDNYEGIDWYQNNQNPEDFPESDYKLLRPAPQLTLFQEIRDSAGYDIQEVS